MIDMITHIRQNIKTNNKQKLFNINLPISHELQSNFQFFITVNTERGAKDCIIKPDLRI